VLPHFWQCYFAAVRTEDSVWQCIVIRDPTYKLLLFFLLLSVVVLTGQLYVWVMGKASGLCEVYSINSQSALFGTWPNLESLRKSWSVKHQKFAVLVLLRITLVSAKVTFSCWMSIVSPGGQSFFLTNCNSVCRTFADVFKQLSQLYMIARDASVISCWTWWIICKLQPLLKRIPAIQVFCNNVCD